MPYELSLTAHFPHVFSYLCISQLATLAFGSDFLESGHPSAKGAPKPANDSRSGKPDHVPTFAPSVLKPSPFATLPTGIGWP